MSHTNPLPELPAPDVHSDRFPDSSSAGSYSRTLTAMIQREAYDLGARSTAAQPVSIHKRINSRHAEALLQKCLDEYELRGYERGLASAAAAQPVEQTQRLAALEARTGMFTLQEAANAKTGEWLCIRFNTFEDRTAAWRAINGQNNGQNVDVPPGAAASGDSTPPSAPVQGDSTERSGYRPEAVGQGRWISVDERMPENDDEVLVWIVPTPGRAGYALLDSWHMHCEDPTGMGGPTIEMGYIWRDNDPIEVTHWKRVEPPQAASGSRGD